MSLGEIIRQVLIADVDDGDAATIAANDPAQYDSSSDVPTHLFTSLASLLEVDEDELPRRVIASYGQGKTLPQNVPAIEIKCKVADSFYSKHIQGDPTGAETSEVQILFRTGEGPIVEDGLAVNLELRTRYLLDRFIRDKRGAGAISTSADKTIARNYWFLCCWQRCDEGEIEILAKYTVDFVRRF